MNPIETMSPPSGPVPTGVGEGACPDLVWAEEFIRRVRPYIFVRAEDQLLIKRPNQAQQLNATGVQVLQHLLQGRGVRALLDRVRWDPVKVRQIGLFLFEVKRFLEGGLTEANASAAVTIQPLPLRFSSLPVLAEVAVTYRCNVRCRFCYAGCDRSAQSLPAGREMAAGEIRQVLRQVARDARVPSVSFTGGEPTLRAELPDLIAYAKGLDLRVNLITNGTRIEADYARKLAGAGLDSAQVSLESIRPEVHERITGVPGSFQKTVSGVRHLARAGIRVHTHTTLNRANLEESHRVPEWVKRHLERDRFSMNLVIPSGSGRQARELLVRYREIGPVLDRILEASRRSEVEFMWYSPTPLCVFNPIPRGLGNKGCAACDGLLSVAPDGAVLPCSSWAEPVGNLLRQDFSSIWQSARARWLRGKGAAHSRCQECEHLAVCHGACPLYWQANGYAELGGDGPVSAPLHRRDPK